MTTPTANYGWPKPNPSEPANITHLNSVMDEMDADIKAVSDAKSVKIYSVGAWRIIRKFSIASSGVWTTLTNSALDNESLLWEEQYKEIGNVGNFEHDLYGNFRFTSAGVYRLDINLNFFTMSGSTTSGYIRFVVLPTGAGVDPSVYVKGTYMELGSTTNDFWPLSNFNASFFLSTSHNVSVDTDYVLALSHHTSWGPVTVTSDPADYWPFSQHMSLECVRSL